MPERKKELNGNTGILGKGFGKNTAGDEAANEDARVAAELLKLLGAEKNKQLSDKIAGLDPNMGRALKNSIIGDLGCGVNEQKLEKADRVKLLEAWNQAQGRVLKMNTKEFEGYLNDAEKEVKAAKKALDENQEVRKTLQELQNVRDVGGAAKDETRLMSKLKNLISLKNVSKMMKSMTGEGDKDKKRTSDEIATDFILSPMSYFKFLIIAAAFTPVIGALTYIGVIPFIAFQIKSLLGADGPDQHKYDPAANLGPGKEGNLAEQIKQSPGKGSPAGYNSSEKQGSFAEQVARDSTRTIGRGT